MTRRHDRVAAALGAAALLVSGCGSGGADGASRPGPAAAPSDPVPTATAPRCRPTTAANPAAGTLVEVPAVAYGASVTAAKRTLERAGLLARSPDVDWPHYATGTRPRAGTQVPAGCVVTIRIGDG